MSTRALLEPVRVGAAIVVAMSMAPIAAGQLIPKVPDAPKPTPEYVPPPPAAPAVPAEPPKPAEPEPEVASIVDRDAAGALVVHSMPPEWVALARVRWATAEQEARYRSALEARRAAIDERVSRHSGAAIDLRNRLADPASIKDLSDIVRLRESARPVLPEKVVLEDLVQSGAITPGLRARINREVQAYEVARREGWQQRHADDVMRLTMEVTREKLAEMSYETLESLERQTALVTDRLGLVLQRAGELSGEVRAALEDASTRLAGQEQRGARLASVRQVMETRLDDAGRAALFAAARD